MFSGRAGMNPIYACQLLTACPTSQHPSVSLSSVVVSPPFGSSGTKFTFTTTFNVTNATGAGESAYAVYFPSGTERYVSTQIFENYTPGRYSLDMYFQTENNRTFDIGVYPVVVSICAGQCNGGILLAQGEYSFNISSSSSSST
eukprot:TRINITY_DN3101_c0_g1_i2.p2 TRINITY_DN3101_c0_g1~~TRINITY_DN3101_c0_g1_i2.p2  ORF type:complete len:144 (-),score=49.02 TRINITY_DN3101_c0_g1_i2:133-564(-)